MSRDRKWFGAKQTTERSRQTSERAQVLLEEAEEALQRQDYAAARALYRECLEIFRKLGERKEEAGVLRAMAATHEAEGDYKLARGVYEEVIALFRAIGDNEGLAVALYELGQAAAQRSNDNYARKLLLESKDLSEARGDRQGQALTLYGLSGIAFRESDPGAARALYVRGLEVQRGVRENLDLALSLIRLSRAAAQADDFEAARLLYSESIKQYRNAGYLTAVVPALVRLSESVLAGQDRNLFVGVSQAVRTLYMASKQRKGEPETLCMLGHIVLKAHDTTTAYALFKEALALSRHPDDWNGRALSYLGMGCVAWEEEHDVLARSLFEKSLTLVTEQANRKELLPWLSSMCGIVMQSQDYTTAAVCCARYRTQALGWADLKHYPEALYYSAFLAFKQGELESALQLCEECLLHCKESGLSQMQGGLLCLKGGILYELGDFTNGRALQQQGLALSRKANHTPGTIDALVLLGFKVLPGSDLTYERACLEEALPLCRAENDLTNISYIFNNQGDLERTAGDLPAAYRLYCKSLMLKSQQQDRYGMAYSLEGCALIAIAWKRYPEAAQLFGNAARHRNRICIPLERTRQAERDAAISHVHSALGETEFTAAWAAGEKLTLQEIVEVAFQLG